MNIKILTHKNKLSCFVDLNTKLYNKSELKHFQNFLDETSSKIQQINQGVKNDFPKKKQ